MIIYGSFNNMTEAAIPLIYEVIDMVGVGSGAACGFIGLYCTFAHTRGHPWWIRLGFFAVLVPGVVFVSFAIGYIIGYATILTLPVTISIFGILYGIEKCFRRV